MSEEPPTNPPPPETPPDESKFRSPDSIDVGCMVGLALILIFLPVSLYVGAPLAVLGIAAAALAWGLMRITPRELRNAIGAGKVWTIWFIFLILLEVGIGLYLKYLGHFGGDMIRYD